MSDPLLEILVALNFPFSTVLRHLIYEKFQLTSDYLQHVLVRMADG